MKKLILAAVFALALTGCGTPKDDPVFETLGDIEYDQPAQAVAQEIHFDLPEEVASEAMAGDDGSISYSWEDFEVIARTLDAGDLTRTIETVTGMEADNLTIMGQSWNGMALYQTVWCTTSEDGIRTGRAVIADDGNFHYCVSITAPEDVDTGEIYDQIVSSFRLGEADSEK